MAGWWTFVRIAHVIGASIWVGSLVAFTFFVRPAAEKSLEEADSKRFVDRAGRSLGFFIAGILVPVQLFTGIALLMNKGFRLSGFGSGLYGKLILAKLVLFFVVVGISAAHGVVSSKSRTQASRTLAYLALAGSLLLAALGAALVP
jgi:putative copper export protein